MDYNYENHAADNNGKLLRLMKTKKTETTNDEVFLFPAMATTPQMDDDNDGEGYWKKISHTPVLKNCCDYYKLCLRKTKEQKLQPPFPETCEQCGQRTRKLSLFALKREHLKSFCFRHEKYVIPCLQQKLGLNHVASLWGNVLEQCYTEMTDENSTGDERDVMERVFRIYKYLCGHYLHSVIRNDTCFRVKTENCVLKHIPELCETPCYFNSLPIIKNVSNHSLTTASIKTDQKVIDSATVAMALEPHVSTGSAAILSIVTSNVMILIASAVKYLI